MPNYRVSYSWLHGVVKPYFFQQGINLLRDDMIFIEKCLGNIPPERHRLVMRDYLSIWNTKVAENKSAESTSINPRYEANVFLRNVSGVSD